MSVLLQPQYQNEAAAYEWVEARLWPNGPECPRCKETTRVGKLNGKSTRIGVYKCYACRKPFTVKVGTVLEGSNFKMHLWLQAFYLMCSSKKGVSANQLARLFKCHLKTAWFVGHRVREALRTGTLAAPLGQAGGSAVVEADETYIGTRRGAKKPKGGTGHKHAVLALVERGGEVRSFHVPNAKVATILPIVNDNIAREARVMTDDAAAYYNRLGHFAGHETVGHAAGEYVRGEVHTNTVESYFALFKRGMRGIYQHCDERHLHRYLAEFDFRHNNRVALGIGDEQRAENAVRGVKGKRLTYKAGTQR